MKSDSGIVLVAFTILNYQKIRTYAERLFNMFPNDPLFQQAWETKL